MPSPPFANLRAAINGGAPTTGGITATLAATVQLSADPAGLSGAGQIRFELYEYPPGYTAPAGWSTKSDGFTYFFAGTTPPAFTLSLWGKYLVRLVLNNGITIINNIPSTSPNLVDESTAIRVFSASGLDDFAAGETTQFSAQRAWVASQKANLRVIDAGGGGGGGSAEFAVRTVVLNNVINLSSWPVVNDGVTHVAGDKVLLARQTTTSENDIYTVGTVTSGNAPLTVLVGTRTVGAVVLVTDGATFPGKQWALKAIGTYDPIIAANDTAIGVHGATTELAFNGTESGTAARPREWVNRDGDFTTIAASTTAVIFTMSPVAEGFPNGMTFVQAEVGFEWPTLSLAAHFTRAATFLNGAPPVLQGQGPTAAAFTLPTSANATVDWVVSGNAVTISVHNNHGTAALVVNYACVKGVMNCR